MPNTVPSLLQPYPLPQAEEGAIMGQQSLQYWGQGKAGDLPPEVGAGSR